MKKIILTLSFFPIFLFPKSIISQENSEILSQLFYGAYDIVDQAEELISLSVDAVWYASDINGNKTTTGTLTQNATNYDLWTYSSSPFDKLVLVFADNSSIRFKFDQIDGFVDETANDFKNSHAMDFSSELADLINLRIQSRIGPFNDRIEWNRTITGKTIVGETSVNVNINDIGNKNEDVSSGYAFGDYYNQSSGSVSTSYANFTINESYKTNLGHNSNKGIFVQSREIFNSNSVSGDFGSFQFNNAHCFWVGGTAFGDSAYVGIYNKAIEVYNWAASGQLLKNNQIYGDIMYDRQIIENSSGAYIIANCQDGNNFYLYRVLYPPIITNVKFKTDLNTDLLSQNYPNPFSSYTTINYHLNKASNVCIKIINSNGQTIDQLVSNRQVAGKHQIEFNGNDLPPGVYYYKIETDFFSETKKMLLRK